MSDPVTREAATTAAPGDGTVRVVAARDVPPDGRRGGVIRVLLGPRTVGSTSGFMGVATLGPGERIAEHYHPYSEEFLYVTRGRITVDLDGEEIPLSPGEALFIPINARHRLRNVGDEPAEAVFQLGPLAPRPELGHVDTERVDTERVDTERVDTERVDTERADTERAGVERADTERAGAERAAGPAPAQAAPAEPTQAAR